MPAGGFGNLIALPLQHARRADGCTVFLDEALQPYPDQWGYLAAVRRLDRDRVDAILGEAAQRGGTLGFHAASGPAADAPRRVPVPPAGAVTVSLTARIELPTAELSPAVGDRLRRAAGVRQP
jgi:hypothetical protein